MIRNMLSRQQTIQRKSKGTHKPAYGIGISCDGER